MSVISSMFGGVSSVVWIWVKWGIYSGVLFGIGYMIYIYFFEYNVVVEYIKVMGNGALKEVKIRGKRDDKTGTVRYKLWRTNLALKRPDDFSFITILKGRKEKIRIIATADKQYYFARLNLEKKQYDCIPAEIEEWSMLAEEQLRNKYLNRKDMFEKYAPLFGIAVGAIVFIVVIWLIADLITSQTTTLASVANSMSEAARVLAEKQSPLPDPILPN